MRLIPVMLALLLALSPGAVAVQASAPTAPAPAQTTPSSSLIEDRSLAQTDGDTIRLTTAGNTTNVTTLGSPSERAAITSPALSLGTSLAMDRDEVETRLSVKVLDKRLQTANTIEKRKQILNRYRYQIENQIISLKARERQATQAFLNETISENEYLRTLGRIDAKAGKLRTLVETLQSRADSIPRVTMDTESYSLNGKLLTLEGPVRNRISAAVQGQNPSTRTYVAANENGVIVSSIHDGQYVREIVRRDRRNPALSDKSTIGSARDSIIAKYPWAFDNRRSTGTNQQYGTNNIYRMWIRHTHGEVVAYYDGGTESVFREIQHKRLTGDTPLPTGPSVTNTSENLTVTVNRTYAGGPLRVELTNETGAPVSGEVRVDGELVGRTNADGLLWTLSPADQFEVSASYDFRTVNLTATPVQS